MTAFVCHGCRRAAFEGSDPSHDRQQAQFHWGVSPTCSAGLEGPALVHFDEVSDEDVEVWPEARTEILRVTKAGLEIVRARKNTSGVCARMGCWRRLPYDGAVHCSRKCEADDPWPEEVQNA